MRVRRITTAMRNNRTVNRLQMVPGESKPNSEFRIALCELLASAGNADDLCALQICAAIPPITTFGTKVQSVAQSGVLRLRARLLELEQPNTLLRPVKAPVTDPDELLRAAGDGTVTSRDELLRSSALS